MAVSALAKTVAGILQDPLMAKVMNFTVCRISVSYLDLCRVAQAILTSRITVKLNKGLTSGGYDNVKDTFNAPDDDLTTPAARAVVVHEGVHAANDMAGKKLIRIDDETAGYVSHFIYLRVFDPRFSGGEMPAADGTPTNDMIRKLLGVANQIIGGFPVTSGQIDNIQSLIMLLPGYANARTMTIRHNGLKRRF